MWHLLNRNLVFAVVVLAVEMLVADVEIAFVVFVLEVAMHACC